MLLQNGTKVPPPLPLLPRALLGHVESQDRLVPGVSVVALEHKEMLEQRGSRDNKGDKENRERQALAALQVPMCVCACVWCSN